MRMRSRPLRSKPTRDPKEIAQIGIISANGDYTIGNIIAREPARDPPCHPLPGSAACGG